MCPAWARLFVRFFSWHCRKIWAEKCWKQFQVEDNSAWDHYIWRTNEEYFLLFGRTDHDDGQELQEDQPLWFLVHRDWCVLVLLQLLGEPEQSLPHLWFEDHPVSCDGLRVACLCAGVKAVAVLAHSVPQCGRTHSSMGVFAVPGMLACERKGASALRGAALRQGARRGAQRSRGSAAVCRQHCCLVTFLGTLSAPGLWKLLKIFMPGL